MTITARRFAALALLAAWMALPGCQAAADLMAKAIGAPTSAQVNNAAEKLEEAEDKVAELEHEAEHAAQQAAAMEAQAKDTNGRIGELRTLWARMAGQVETMSGEAADALIASMDSVRAQMRALEEQEDQALAVAAGYRAEVTRINVAVASSRRDLADAEAELLGYVDATHAAIEGVQGFVTSAGDVASSLGVPGARETADKVNETITGSLAGLFATTTLASAYRTRRRRQQRDAAQADADALERVVVANSKFGLVKDDANARAAAKDFVGSDAHLVLKRVLAEAGVDAAA